jgi:hypothetical protein
MYIYTALGRFQEPKIGALQEDLKGSPVVIWNLRYICICMYIYVYKPRGNMDSEVRMFILACMYANTCLFYLYMNKYLICLYLYTSRGPQGKPSRNLESEVYIYISVYIYTYICI